MVANLRGVTIWQSDLLVCHPETVKKRLAHLLLEKGVQVETNAILNNKLKTQRKVKKILMKMF